MPATNVERKLATVLFVDIVDSTRLVTDADPEVVRRRVTQFFDRVSHCVEVHGGIVEKFAGDAVLAAFGIPQAHEDDAERAGRAALSMRDAVREIGFEARFGIEAGEVVVDQAESTFATGEAVNMAARLQQAAKPGEILLGPTAYRLTRGRLLAEDAGPLELKGVFASMRIWRVVSALDVQPGTAGLGAPLVGRETELELLRTTFERTLRGRRAHLFTIYGEPGVGKSRLAREFIDGIEDASVLSGRCLPYGEGVTYWPLAEMVKVAAGISDDEPLEEAFEKLRNCCEDEAVADLIALAAGLLEALEGETSPQEIAWAAREVMASLAAVRPLVLLVEDINWAEEPMLDLVEHLADTVRAPLLILCLARPDLLDIRPSWGGGRVRSTAIELEPLSEAEAEQLVEELVAELDAPPALPKNLLDRTEGNPLFLEEMIRMLVESGNGSADRVPDTLQALIAARIDHLPAASKNVLQRAAVIGRVFWKGAVERLASADGSLDALLDDLQQRELILREPRSSITGEKAYRFKHVLIREVAYSGLSKEARARHHGEFAVWLKENAADELVEIRAHHLDQAAHLLAELDGAPPATLAAEAAAALTAAGKRTMAREEYKAARKLLLRAVELEPTLPRRYGAARAAWRLGDLAAVSVEMEKVRSEAESGNDPLTQALSLTALGDAVMRQIGDVGRAQELVDAALELQADETDPDAHFDALVVRATIGAWRGDMTEAIRYLEQAFAIALAAGRKDLQTLAAQGLAQAHIVRLELDDAERLLDKALELAEESGSPRARGNTLLTVSSLQRARGALTAAEASSEEARSVFAEVGNPRWVAAALGKKADIARLSGDLRAAEKLMREAARLLAPLSQTGELGETQAFLACVIAAQGRPDEAERFVVEAEQRIGPEDPAANWLVRLARGAVSEAYGRDAEAEEQYLGALEMAHSYGLSLLEVDSLRWLVTFLETRGRLDEAAGYEGRLAELSPQSTARIA